MKIYLAGPDIFRPDSQAWADNARSLCRQYGFDPLLPIDHHETDPQKIFEANLLLIKKAQIVCANLNPFRGHEPDSGTAFEIGYAFALGKKVCGYVSSLQSMKEKVAHSGNGLDGKPVDVQGYGVEDFGLPVNLMLGVPCHVIEGGLEECLQAIKKRPAIAHPEIETGGQKPGATPLTIFDLWHSNNPDDWDQAIKRYWSFVKKENVALEESLNAFQIERIHEMSPKGWYDFLHDEYFRWKYTQPNRYATTTLQLQKYVDSGSLDELDTIRRRLLELDVTATRKGLQLASSIRGLGTAGASGLLALMYPTHFGTVDQFVVKALREIADLPESPALRAMNDMSLTAKDGELLIDMMSRKAAEINQLIGEPSWNPRRIDMVLWTYGR